MQVNQVPRTLTAMSRSQSSTVISSYRAPPTESASAALATRPSIFWENKRVVTAIESPALGQVQFVEIGATMVGSIRQTYTPGETVAKGDEKGYFAFGGSSVAVLFEKGRIEIDADLLENTDNGLGTYARVGERMGRALDQG